MKRLLIVVDFQHDFVDGSLGFPAAADLDAVIAAKIDAYHDAGDTVVFTMDTHFAGYPDTLEGRALPVVHCTEGTPGWELYGSVAKAKLDRDRVFRKPTFGSAELFEWLKRAEDVAAESGVTAFSSIELVGLVSNICVLSNTVLAKAACPEVPIIVDAAATGSADEHLNTAALDVLEGIQVQVTGR